MYVYKYLNCASNNLLLYLGDTVGVVFASRKLCLHSTQSTKSYEVRTHTHTLESTQHTAGQPTKPGKAGRELCIVWSIRLRSGLHTHCLYSVEDFQKKLFREILSIICTYKHNKWLVNCESNNGCGLRSTYRAMDLI